MNLEKPGLKKKKNHSFLSIRTIQIENPGKEKGDL